MSDPSLLAALLKQLNQPPPVQSEQVNSTVPNQATRSPHSAPISSNVQPEFAATGTEFSPAVRSPRSGGEFYRQRLVALRVGRLYTRLPIDSFYQFWAGAVRQPTYSQWRRLLALEAKAAAYGQKGRRLSVMVGDSLSMWFPSDRLPPNQLWLNQSLSGETTHDILQRLPDFSKALAHTIYVMAGVNDLKQGATDNEILWNIRQIVRRLQHLHPHTRIVVQSILPTRSAMIPGKRIAWLNQRLSAIVQQEGAAYLDLYSYLADVDGGIRHDLTTDGIHLNANGYAAWQSALLQTEVITAQGG